MFKFEWGEINSRATYGTEVSWLLFPVATRHTTLHRCVNRIFELQKKKNIFSENLRLYFRG